MVSVINISASQLVPVLRPLMQEWSSISAYGPTNTLILMSSAANINQLVRIIHEMDQKIRRKLKTCGLNIRTLSNLVSVLQLFGIV